MLHSRHAVAALALLSLVALRAPRQLAALFRAVLSSEAWKWQFRPPDPPTRLLRQTWAAAEEPAVAIEADESRHRSHAGR